METVENPHCYSYKWYMTYMPLTLSIFGAESFYENRKQVLSAIHAEITRVMNDFPVA